MQIGRRVRRLERARLAAHRQRMGDSEMSNINVDSDAGMGINPDARYEVPNFQRDAFNIYSFLHAHKGDPAITVCPPCH
jgi:hypothetical protein